MEGNTTDKDEAGRKPIKTGIADTGKTEGSVNVVQDVEQCPGQLRRLVHHFIAQVEKYLCCIRRTLFTTHFTSGKSPTAI